MEPWIWSICICITSKMYENETYYLFRKRTEFYYNVKNKSFAITKETMLIYKDEVYFPEDFLEIGAYFPEVFRETGAYFLEVVKMAMLQKSHMRQPSQGWCGRHTARIVVNRFVQGLGTACAVELYLLYIS